MGYSSCAQCLEQLTTKGVNIFSYGCAARATWMRRGDLDACGGLSHEASSHRYFWIVLFLFVSLVAVWLYRLTKVCADAVALGSTPLLDGER